MRFRGRALYNLLNLSDLEGNDEVKPWQVAPYRQISSEDLFIRLANLGIFLTEESYLAYAESCDTPEELIDCLWVEEEHDEKQEEAYLITFELWRRYLPKKQSLSLFGDELDHLISLYDKGELLDEELLQKSLSDLEDILDQAVDSGTKPEEIFEMISQYCAHDVETFLYDYIIDQMDSGNETYASELLDGFFDYVAEKKWFDFLKARLFALSDSEESDVLLIGLIEQLEEDADSELCFEICRFLVNRGDTKLFIRSAHLLLSQIETEEDFRIFLELLAEFYRCLDQEPVEKAVQDLITKRKSKKDEETISSSDKSEVLEFLQDSNGNKL